MKKATIKFEIRRLCDNWHNNFKDRSKYNNNYDEYLGIELSNFIIKNMENENGQRRRQTNNDY